MTSFRTQVDELDLEAIIRKIQRKLEWSDDRTERAVQGYRDYLFERGIGGDAKSLLTQDVDEVWHMHILDTHRYARDCEALFGHFLHHVPSYAEGAGDNAMATCSDMPYVGAASGGMSHAFATCSSDLPAVPMATCD